MYGQSARADKGPAPTAGRLRGPRARRPEGGPRVVEQREQVDLGAALAGPPAPQGPARPMPLT